ncbi:protein phosphatase 2C, partial [Bacillus wiedmannii]|nr:protein phosphatase 2C [Bacillus wiedmannii]
RQFLGYLDVTDGTRGTNWVTRDEMAGMLYQYRLKSPAWSPETGFHNSNNWAKSAGIFDGSRGNDFATRAEVVSMIYNASINGKLKRA